MEILELDGPGGGWRVLVPRTRRERMRGLRGHPPPDPRRRGMLFLRCRSVQTFGMATSIEVTFLDAELRVLETRVVRPRRLVLPRRHTRHVLECGVGSELRIGDRFRPARPAGR